MIERFWTKVRVVAPDECWEWTGSRQAGRHGGYGHFTIKRKIIKAHRFSWLMHFGDIPAGMLVLHHCDNPPCVNPAHLFLGSDKDNMRDMYGKGRGRKATGDAHGMRKFPRLLAGARNGIAVKLTREDAEKIRALYANGGRSCPSLAEEFGVSKWTIQRVVRGSHWTLAA